MINYIFMSSCILVRGLVNKLGLLRLGCLHSTASLSKRALATAAGVATSEGTGAAGTGSLSEGTRTAGTGAASNGTRAAGTGSLSKGAGTAETRAASETTGTGSLSKRF